MAAALLAQAGEKVPTMSSRVDCNQCASCEKSGNCCQKLLAWITYRPLPSCGACAGCRGCTPQASPPLFAYFQNPDCPVCDVPPSVRHRHQWNFNLFGKLGSKKCACGNTQPCETCTQSCAPTQQPVQGPKPTVLPTAMEKK